MAYLNFTFNFTVIKALDTQDTGKYRWQQQSMAKNIKST